MNCTCITDVPKKILEKGLKFKNKKVLKVDLISVAFIFSGPGIGTVTTSELKLEVEGLKSPQKQSILHSFCPFCGVSTHKDLEKPEEIKPENN